MRKALIYIPDISGFTKFVTETELQHSQHILATLLELIIEKNELELNISEIEGDAVLFYKIGAPISFEKIHNQSKNIFIAFHEKIREMDSKRKCECGACSSIPNLSIKFITHYGETSEVKISTFNKLIGSAVILAHRLLKNSVPSTHYLLMTDNYLDETKSFSSEKIDWEIFKNLNEEYENFGVVTSKYINFKTLLDSMN